MYLRSTLAVGVGIAVVFIGCASSSPDTPIAPSDDGGASECLPGVKAACVGTANCQGEQTCKADRTGYGPCMCIGADASVRDASEPPPDVTEQPDTESPVDAAPQDTGAVEDAGKLDTGGPVDAGKPDTGPPSCSPVGAFYCDGAKIMECRASGGVVSKTCATGKQCVLGEGAKAGACATPLVLASQGAENYRRVMRAMVDCWGPNYGVTSHEMCNVIDGSALGMELTLDATKTWCCDTAQASDFGGSEDDLKVARDICGCGITGVENIDWQKPIPAASKGTYCLWYDASALNEIWVGPCNTF